MSAPICSKGQDDDGPEEGEIQDDDDDIAPPEIGNRCPNSNNIGRVSEDFNVSPRTRLCFERDIREFESSRSRLARSRLSLEEAESSYAVASTTRGKDSFVRRKDRRSKSGFTHGKENRHVQRSKSPSSKARYRMNVELHSSERCRESSPLHRYSSQSSVESEDKASPDHVSYHRGRQKRFRSGREKRSSSSPDLDHIPSKRKPHHSVKCPLIKVLHSVAKETRLIAMETAESNPSGNSLKKRLLNMGVIPRSDSICSSPNKDLNTTDGCVGDSAMSNECGTSDNFGSRTDTKEVSSSANVIESEHIQKEDTSDEVMIIPPVSKSIPEVVTLTDSDDNSTGLGSPLPDRSCGSCSYEKATPVPLVPQPSPGRSVITASSTSETLQNNALSGTEGNINSTDVSGNLSDDEDVGRLRFLALQSKKHEPTPPGDDDVLQLRLAALKTAIVKKFKGRKQEKISCETNAQSNSNPPLSPLDNISSCLSPVPVDEVTSPVDMDIAETDDEGMESDPPKSPAPDLFLQDLLPPPPPPDLPLDLFYHDQNPDNVLTGICMYPSNELPPPPLPQFFQEMLGTMCDSSLAPALPLAPTELVNDSSELDQTTSHETSNLEANIEDSSITATFVKKKKKKKHVRIPVTSQIRLQSKTRPNLLQIPISAKSECNSLINESHPLDHNPPPDCMDIDSMIVLDEIYDSSPVHDQQGCCIEGEREEIHIEQNLSKQSNENSVSPEQQKITIDNFAESDKVKASGALPRRTSLEEEEQALRQRLLMNLANKRILNSTGDGGKDPRCNSRSEKTELDLKEHNVDASSEPEKPSYLHSVEKISSIESSALSPTLRYKPNNQVIQKPVSLEKRVIVNLDDDSDSSVDYSEAEALGMMCVKNKEDWQRQMKEFDPNLFKINFTQLPCSKSLGKVTSQKKSSAQSESRLKLGEKALQFATLSDLENSVDRFLKGVRSSHDAKASTSTSSTSTPVAVRHLPASQQEEYRRLKQQIAELEKQKISQNKSGVPSKTSGNGGKRLLKMNPSVKLIQNSSLSSHSIVTSNHSTSVASGKSTLISETIVSAVSQSHQPQLSIIPSKCKSAIFKANLISSLNPPPKSNSHISTSCVPSAVKGKESNLKSLRVTVPQTNLNGKEGKNSREVSLSTTHPAAVTMHNTASLSASKLSVPPENPNLIATPIHHPSNGVLSKQLSLNRLSSLEKRLILERTTVLSELSALAKLLTQVDKSVEAQSHTATEVSNLLDQLCLAAGRWHAQNHTVTNLVAKVAQGQRELSQGHRRCVAVSKSCAELGSQVKGKLYRIPADKASIMRLQLKNVHEKTQALAKRRALEQNRKNMLERRAEKCLTKLFKDTRQINPNDPKMPAKLQDAKDQNIIHGTPSTQPGNDGVEQPKTLTETKNHGSVSSCTSNTVVHDTINASAQLVSKMLAYRIAQSKVRSARAYLNSPSFKAKVQKKKRKLEVKRKDLKGSNEINRDGKEELSDMDISLDDEENDAKTKFQDENNEVVDMALSPDVNSSPDASPSHSQSHSKEIAPSSSLTSCLQSPNCDEQEDKRRKDLMEECSENIANNETGFTVTTKKNTDSSNPLLNNSNSDMSSLMKIKPVFRDYISPLGGLKVLSPRDDVIESKGEDPHAILCPYDLNGKCQDSDCPFRHQQ